MQLIAELVAEPSEVRRARGLLADRLGAWRLDGDAADTALLLLSEVVTNAVRHGAPPVLVLAGLAASGALRVEVDDRSATHPVRRSPRPGDDGGRGLQLLELLASAWGAASAAGPRGEPAGKCVWFELPAPGRGAPTVVVDG